MNRACRKYLLEIKTLFPIKRKQERLYLRNLASDINEFCEDTKVTTKQELYESYGTPYEVMNSYFSTINVDQVVNKLRVSKTIRRAVFIVLMLATIATVVHCVIKLEAFSVFKRQEMVSSESVIAESSLQENLDKLLINNIGDENL